MRSFVVGLIAGCVSLAFGAGSVGAQELVEHVAQGCEQELKTYCSNVTPGQGRGLACLYAHGDKLSGRCEYALYDAAVQLERFVAALTYVANECDADIDEHCAGVEIGEGRVVQCLKESKISKRCDQALADVRVK
jgi:hypothetical protein